MQVVSVIGADCNVYNCHNKAYDKTGRVGSIKNQKFSDLSNDFDEILDSGIDGYALFAVLNILKNKTKDSNLSCVVISHRNEIMEELTETFDHVITVVKSKGTSSLKDETD